MEENCLLMGNCFFFLMSKDFQFVEKVYWEKLIFKGYRLAIGA